MPVLHCSVFSALLFICTLVPCSLQAQSDLLFDIQQLSDDRMSGRKTASQGAELARHYIQQRFSDLGLTALKANFQHPFSYRTGFSDKEGINLVAELKGCTQPDAYIVITAGNPPIFNRS